MSLLAAGGQHTNDALPGKALVQETTHTPSKRAAADREEILRRYGKLPLRFEANVGQVRGESGQQVQFLSRGEGYTLFLTSREAVLALQGSPRKEENHSSSNRKSKQDRGVPRAQRSSPEFLGSAVLQMKLVGANRDVSVEGSDELPSKSNYFIGSDASQWRTNVRNYGKVRYRNVYPGVDLVYYGNPGQLEYDFVVAPGADPGAIGLTIAPAWPSVTFREKAQQTSALRIARDGDLVLATNGEEVRFQEPVVYQAASASDARLRTERVPVEGHYSLDAHGRIGFELGKYDRTKALVIDPTLSYSSFLGGTEFEQGNGIAVDTAGNAYVTGCTGSLDFPVSGGVLEPNFVGGGNCDNTGDGGTPGDAFVTKVNAAGSALVYSSYLGGSGRDQGGSIAVDSLGNAYVVGQTFSSNFPTTPGAFDRTCNACANGSGDAFVSKLNPDGSALVYSTFLGGSEVLGDFANAVAVDASGNAYVTGLTHSNDFPVTSGALKTTCNCDGQNNGNANAFVTKLNSAGSGLVYSTYLGGTYPPSLGDPGNGIAVDASGNAFVVGQETSYDFPVTQGAFQTARPSNAASVAYVSKLNATGSALIYSTYLGGSDSNYGTGIALDAADNAYVSGYTSSVDFPTTPGAFQTSCVEGTIGCNTSFASKLDRTGSALLYSTFLGGTTQEGTDGAAGIAVDSSGNAYLTGTTFASNFPVTQGALKTQCSGTCLPDGYLTELNATGSAVLYSTYIGGSGPDGGSAIAIDSSGNVYLTGETGSADFPVTPGVFQPRCGGGCPLANPLGPRITDAFVSKFSFGSSSGSGFEQVPGALSQIAVGSAGSVWGLNSAGQIYWFNRQTQSWQSTPGLLAQIAVADDGAAWGINSAQQIYRYDAQAQVWQQIPGALTQIAVGSAGAVWGINKAQQIFRFDPGTEDWERIPGTLVQIAVGADDSVWGLNAQQQIFYFDPETQDWDQIPGLLTQIAVGSASAVWGINAEQQIYRYNPQTQSWDQIPGALTRIAVGANGAVWGINAAQQVYNYDPQTQGWDQIPGDLTQIAMGSDGSVWGIDAEQRIFELTGQPPVMPTWGQIPGGLAQIAVGTDGAVWGLTAAQQIYTFNAKTQSWNQIPGALAHIAVGFGGAVWGINSAQQIYRYNPQTQSWDQIPGALTQIAAGPDGAVWGLDSAQQIYRFNPQTQGWNQIPGALTQIAVGADGTVWGLTAAQQIYTFNSKTQSWYQIPGLLAHIAVGSANSVWGINAAGEIYSYNSQSQNWDQIPGQLSQIAVAYDGAVWGINVADEIYRYNSQTQSWDQIPGALSQIAVGSSGTVWGLNSAEQIFRWQ